MDVSVLQCFNCKTNKQTGKYPICLLYCLFFKCSVTQSFLFFFYFMKQSGIISHAHVCDCKTWIESWSFSSVHVFICALMLFVRIFCIYFFVFVHMYICLFCFLVTFSKLEPRVTSCETGLFASPLLDVKLLKDKLQKNQTKHSG